MRTNGFQAPLEPLQIVTWLLFVVLVVEFYVIMLPALPRVAAIVTAIFFGLFASTSCVVGYIACKIDPIDPNLSQYRNGGQPQADPSTSDKTFCFLCQLYVIKGSRHCRYCDKCVEKFDHHCRWLNNCVGKRNYPSFVILLCSTFAMTALQLGLSIWLVVAYHTSKSTHNRVDSRYAHLSYLGHTIIVYIFGALLVPFVGLLLQLLGFHAVLFKEGLTTYDYIVKEQKRDRERKGKRQRKKEERENKAAAEAASSNATASGTTTTANGAAAAAANGGGGDDDDDDDNITVAGAEEGSRANGARHAPKKTVNMQERMHGCLESCGLAGIKGNGKRSSGGAAEMRRGGGGDGGGGGDEEDGEGSTAIASAREGDVSIGSGGGGGGGGSGGGTTARTVMDSRDSVEG